jgi:4-deoxy-L-threo-5-hexosulose-uronate ketol-isomerase
MAGTAMPQSTEDPKRIEPIGGDMAVETKESQKIRFRNLHAPDPDSYMRQTTEETRRTFLIEDLFTPAELAMVYYDVDRAVIGTAVPWKKPLALESRKELASKYFTERRELGVINVGGAGSVEVGDQKYDLGNKDVMYVGRGNEKVVFHSASLDKPAAFYFVSYPAHTEHPVRRMTKAEAEAVRLGSKEGANERTIYKCIQPSIMPTCQLVMGFTELAPGSVWNTMPVHTHDRRSEVYMYFDIPAEGVVLHCVGRPEETRHVVVRNRQIVVSPSWSIHCGVGTVNYTFVWAMGGENQEFADMDAVPMARLG